MRRFSSFILVLCLAGCASTARGRAIQTGQVSKELVDAGARTLGAYLDGKADECEEYKGDALRLCLGKLASNPDAIDAAFEAVRSAQLALYIALAAGTPEEVRQATRDLILAVQEVAALVRAAKEQGNGQA